jgi:adenosine deaminase
MDRRPAQDRMGARVPRVPGRVVNRSGSGDIGLGGTRFVGPEMMTNPPTASGPPLIESLSKVELHRHLEGAVRLPTLLELARGNGLAVPHDEQALRARVQVLPQDPLTWGNFLSKFDTLRLFFSSRQVIQRLVREAIEDLAADHVVYAEIRFTPAALAASRGFTIEEVIDWVIDAGREAMQTTGIRVGWIASINRHEPVSVGERVAQAAADRLARGIVGLDLAGNEVDFSTAPFEPVFRAAAEAGLGITLHAGEWADGGSVYHAMHAMGAQRIAHGVRAVEDQRALDLARERRIAFEICLTSNVASGAVRSFAEHPLPRLIQAGIPVTLNSDDPSICGIRLSDEYRAAIQHYALSLDSLRGMILTAAQAAFLPDRERRQLEARLQAELFAVSDGPTAGTGPLPGSTP